MNRAMTRSGLPTLIILTTITALLQLQFPVLGVADDLEDSVEGVISPLIESGERVGIAVGVVYGGVWRSFGYGEEIEGSGTGPDENTIYQIASTTKTFTAILLSDMVKRGEVGLDDPLGLYLPVAIPSLGGRNITLLDLATHTSGLPPIPANFEPDDELNPYADYSMEMMYEFLEDCTLSYIPGHQYQYSNLGVALLGYALELAAGKPYEELIIERICRPLGMYGTLFELDPGHAAMLAQGYWSELNGSLTPPSFVHEAVPAWDTGVFSPAGGLYSSVHDMLAYIAANLGSTGMEISSAMEITQTSCREAYPSMDICLGWHRTTRDGAQVLMHHGATFGFNSNLLFSRDEGIGVVLLSNTYVPESDSLDEAGFEILQILRERECMSNYRKLLDAHASFRETHISEMGSLNRTCNSLVTENSDLMVDIDELESALENLNASRETLLLDKIELDEKLREARNLVNILTIAMVASAVFSILVVLRRRG